MSTDVDIDALIAPLETGDGVGEDLRQDYSPTSVYQRLRDARADARAEERARDSEEDREGGVAEGWRIVRRLATEALSGSTKDFEIAAWLTEALARQDGLAGLSAGARVMSALLANFWDAGFPQPDEDGLETRSSPLGGLAGGETDGTVMQALRRTTLYRRPSGEVVSLYRYEAALETAAIADEARRELRYEQGILPLETLETEARFDRRGLAGLIADATEARAAWQEFQDQIDARFGYDAPPTRRVAEVLDRLVEVAQRLGGEADAPAMVGEAETAPAGGDAPVAMAAGGFALPAGGPAGREQALKMLEQIAAFFQRTEPHSFLAYTLTDAARRGRMTLPELLSEVLADDGARTAMLTALGIRPGTMEESG